MVIPAEQAVWKQPSYAILWVNAKRLPPAVWRKPYVMRRYRPARRQADRWKVDGLDDIAPVLLLTSSLRHPKILIKEFSYFLMPCHQHGLRINLLV